MRSPSRFLGSLGDIDVCVGDAKVTCKRRVSPNTLQSKQLRGNVFVSECLDPGAWLPKLAGLRLKGGLNEVIVVLPDETGAEWFKALAQGEWYCVFPTGVGRLPRVEGAEVRRDLRPSGYGRVGM